MVRSSKKIFDIIDKNKQMGFDCEYLYNKIIRINKIDYIIKGVILCNKDDCDSLDIFAKENNKYKYINSSKNNAINDDIIYEFKDNFDSKNENNNPISDITYVITQNNDSNNIKNWKLVHFINKTNSALEVQTI